MFIINMSKSVYMQSVLLILLFVKTLLALFCRVGSSVIVYTLWLLYCNFKRGLFLLVLRLGFQVLLNCLDSL